MTVRCFSAAIHSSINFQNSFLSIISYFFLLFFKIRRWDATHWSPTSKVYCQLSTKTLQLLAILWALFRLQDLVCYTCKNFCAEIYFLLEVSPGNLLWMVLHRIQHWNDFQGLKVLHPKCQTSLHALRYASLHLIGYPGLGQIWETNLGYEHHKVTPGHW